MPKGSQFERDICRTLSNWWSKGENDNLFWRTSNSGGRMTTLAKQGKAGKFHHGDICAIDPSGQALIDFCTIECKKGYSRASIMDLVDRPIRGAKEPEYSKWIFQARREAESAGAYGWTLIHKKDRREALMFMPIYVFNTLELEPDACFADDLGCVRLKAFLEIDPDVIRVFQSEREVV